ncbi:Hsp20/alpha crystallin family protein [Streptomyces sp. NPDC053542]|uniref:Hsp20/alpha crystallin family protein n=1 Tax=Streptomyces sp. NPDC053542 TaxID=3365710 RepID=UPI0037D198D7
MNLPVRRAGGGLEQRQGTGLSAWDPFAEFETLWNQMGQLFGRTVSPGGREGTWMPTVEEEELDDAYLVRAELPGIPQQNVNVEVDDNELRITGEVSEEQQGNVLSRRTGRFFYRTGLPSGVDSERTEAELTDGILRVRLPKSGSSKRRRIALGGKE